MPLGGLLCGTGRAGLGAGMRVWMARSSGESGGEESDSAEESIALTSRRCATNSGVNV